MRLSINELELLWRERIGWLQAPADHCRGKRGALRVGGLRLPPEEITG
jgi:hypothetical protein